MRSLRLSMVGMMAVVALVAINLAIRIWLKNVAIARVAVWYFIICGAIPMANILLVGMLLLARRHTRQSRVNLFWVGFEIFGWIAFFVSVSCLIWLPGPVILIIEDIRRVLNSSVPYWIAVYAVFPIFFIVPQVLFAALGARLVDRFWRTTRPGRQGSGGPEAANVVDPMAGGNG